MADLPPTRVDRRVNIVRHRAGVSVRRAVRRRAGRAAARTQRLHPDVGGQPARVCWSTAPSSAVDLLGEAGMSVQEKPITGPDDEAQWLDETLAGLGADAGRT